MRGRELEAWYAREGAELHRAVNVFALSEETRRSIIDDYGVPASRFTRVGTGSNLTELPVVDRPHRAPTVLFILNPIPRSTKGLGVTAAGAVLRRSPEVIL